MNKTLQYQLSKDYCCTPDVLGIAAVKDGNIIGMAGTGADSPYMYQIGINVLPESWKGHRSTACDPYKKQGA